MLAVSATASADTAVIRFTARSEASRRLWKIRIVATQVTTAVIAAAPRGHGGDSPIQAPMNGRTVPPASAHGNGLARRASSRSSGADGARGFGSLPLAR